MADATRVASNSNPMLGSQLVAKSILSPTSKQAQNGSLETKKEKAEQEAETTTPNSQLPQPKTVQVKAKESQKNCHSSTSSKLCQSKTNINNVNNNNNINESKHLKSLLCQTQEAQVQQVNHEPLETSDNILNSSSSSSTQQPTSKDLELFAKEAQELKIKTRKLQLEIDEKNEIINVLKDELETTKESSDKFQRENLQLVKDSKRVKFLQDENDFLQDKLGNVEKLELEIKRLKEKLAEVDFLKLRIGELEEDKTRAQDESTQFEDKWKQAEIKLTRVGELESELNKWKSFSHELEVERNSIQTKLLESIEQEAKLNTVNKQVEDEVKRLRSLIKSYEEQRDEEQASNSLILSVKQKQDDSPSSLSQQPNFGDIIDPSGNAFVAPDTSIKAELDKHLEKELNEENRNLKQQLTDREVEINKLLETNKDIRSELEGNKKLISNLRQDLACEKSLASKLTNQLTNFTKQIKNLDKQYFPMHDVSSPNNHNSSSSDKKASHTIGNLRDANIACSSEIGKEKESSLSNSVTSVKSKQKLGQTKDALQCIGDNAIANQHGVNNGEAKKSDNETRQLNITCSSKLSALPKSHSPLDNKVKTSKQSISKAINGTKKPAENSGIKNNLLSVGMKEVEVRRSPSSCVATNKSSTVVVTPDATSVALETFDKGKDESCNKAAGLLSSSAALSNKDCKAIGQFEDLVIKTKLESHDRSEGVEKAALHSSSLSPSPTSPQNLNEELLTRRKHAISVSNNASNNSGNKSNNSATAHVTSASPSLNARSQTSSPLIAINVGHDSGFQSINHGK